VEWVITSVREREGMTQVEVSVSPGERYWVILPGVGLSEERVRAGVEAFLAYLFPRLAPPPIRTGE
jgi:hypothetical protein